MTDSTILQQREQLARTAMHEVLKSQQDESVALFIQHHLEEIEAEYWQQHFATTTPTLTQVLDSLILQHVLYAEDKTEIVEKLDFSLAEDVTDYVICVSFNAQGQVVDISMES